MSREYYLAEYHSAVACLDPVALAAALSEAQAPGAAQAVVAAATGNEPYSILDVDAGRGVDDDRPQAVFVELKSFQADYALNEIPQAAAMVELGRDLGQMSRGDYGPASVAVGEILARYLGRVRVRCRVYALATAAFRSASTTLDDDDPQPYDEHIVLFDGFMTAVAVMSRPDKRVLRLTLTHWLSDLAASSSVSAQIAATSAGVLRFNSALSPYLATPAAAAGNAGALTQTPYGVAQIAIASGPALETDFWGYWQPPVADGGAELYGIQHFLFGIARQDLFAWQTFRSTTLGAAACPPPAADGGRKRNDIALAALRRIEPFTDVTSPSPQALRSAWNAFQVLIRNELAGQQAATAFDVAPGIGRERLAGNQNYSTVGYLYGMPLAFRKSDVGYGVFSPSYGFAADFVSETLGTLGPSSMWDKLAGQYCPKYGLALAPMSTRAVVMPLTPSLRRYWKTIHAPDVFEYRSAIDLPVQIRGVVLLGRSPSSTGATIPAGSNPGDVRALANDKFLATYDSCLDGQFIFREAPAWLAAASVLPPAIAALNLMAPMRAAANSAIATKKSTKPLADLLGSLPFILDEFAGAAGVAGPAAALAAALQSVLTPPKIKFGMAIAYAKALYGYERLRYRTADVSGRFRTDIGPGSTVRVEVPADPFVALTAGEVGPRYVYGVVQRVSIWLETGSGEGARAGTAFRLGFVRRQQEVTPTSDLSTDGHPVWGTVLLGVPLVDSLWVRGNLGLASTLG